MIPVKTTNKLLYFDNPLRNAKPDAPKPREANIRPPLQQREAANAVKMEVILMSFCFIDIILSAHSAYKYLGTSLYPRGGYNHFT